MIVTLLLGLLGVLLIYFSTLQLLRSLGSCQSQFTQGLN